VGQLKLNLGVKTDLIEYRYSFDWLFRLLSEEGIDRVQLGTFFELYQLPDAWFTDLRRRAADWGVRVTSIFTAHRELGGFFRDDGDCWAHLARTNFRRLIEIGGLLGAASVGSNPGAVLRDRMGTKARGLSVYVQSMKELMTFAAEKNVDWLTIEPMSCLAEPPSLPAEILALAGELAAHHAAHPKTTAHVGYCVDVAHGYADAQGQIRHDNLQLLEVALPHTYELHLKNTDRRFDSTFGFDRAGRERGIVDPAAIRDLLHARAGILPVTDLTGFLEISGPKLGRDYSDPATEEALRESIRYLKQTFVVPTPIVTLSATERIELVRATQPHAPEEPGTPSNVQIAPSLMCADLCHLESHVRRLEEAGTDLWHFDLMDFHFAPNMPLGLAVLEQLRPHTGLPVDAHLMVENNDALVRELAKLGVAQVSVHAESARHLDRTLALIRDLGMKAGVALNPATPLDHLRYVLDVADFVLLMTVNPGFAGQRMVPYAIRKIADCRALLAAEGRNIPIEVDGNVSFGNIPRMVAAGADILVAGSSSIFSREGTIRENFARTRLAIAEGMRLRALECGDLTPLRARRLDAEPVAS
jgi:ribulose-phosphate 3-epimerase